MKHEIDARGKQCPLPVVMTKKVLDTAAAGEEVEVLVDNEIAVQNLAKLAKNSGCTFVSQKKEEEGYLVKIVQQGTESAESSGKSALEKGMVVCVASEQMGEGDEELGKILLKGFIFALTQLDKLPETILFYNGGAKLSVEGSVCLEDLKSLEEQGTEILTCGTCLNHYGLTEKLAVGGVTNMYTITETLAKATKIVKP